MAGTLPFEAEPETVAAWRADGAALAFIDVREPWETALCLIPGSLAIPLRELPGRLADLPTEGPLVIVCHHGGRSAQATHWLRARGVGRAVNLAGGIDRWASRMDPEMRRY